MKNALAERMANIELNERRRSETDGSDTPATPSVCVVAKPESSALPRLLAPVAGASELVHEINEPP